MSYSWFSTFPPGFLIASLGALALGISAVSVSRIWPEKSLKRDLVRDLGIALLVAAIVSLVYEGSTRSIAQRETRVDTLNKAMSSFVPANVWQEVTSQVLHRDVLRRNAKIRAKIFRDAQLPDGRKISAPEGQAILKLEYSYDLYGLTTGV